MDSEAVKRISTQFLPCGCTTEPIEVSILMSDGSSKPSILPNVVFCLLHSKAAETFTHLVRLLAVVDKTRPLGSHGAEQVCAVREHINTMQGLEWLNGKT